MIHFAKHFRALLAIAMMLRVALPTLAHDFEVDDIYYNYLDETFKTVEVTINGSSSKYTGVVIIPSSVTYNGSTYTVTSISSSAFYKCSGLTSITIPNSVSSIGEDAFEYCSGLTEVTISDLSAWCKIDFGNDYANPLRYAKKLKLNGSEIKDLVIPNDITEIRNYAFSDCTGLTSVTIGNSVTTIGSYAFSDCTSLTSVTIPNSVTYIGRYAFSDCTNLTSVNIPSSVVSIDLSAFAHTGWYNNQPDGILYLDNCCLGYKGTKPIGSISLKDGTQLIGNSAFDGCSGLTSVTIPNSVTTIDFYAFNGCTGLTSITIPNSVTSIRGGAFGGCTGLTSISIPNSVTTIGYNAFMYTGWYNNQPDGMLYLDNCCLGYKGTKPIGSISLKDGTQLIGSSAFSGCTGLTSVTIPNSVTSIGYEAFCGCSGLTSITIPNSVTSIDSYAFDDCDGLTSITIPNSVTYIGSYAFSDCRGLTSVTIPNSVTLIDSYAFCGCDGLTSITIPNSVTSIGSSAFSGCTGLTSVSIPNSVTSIGSSAFNGCTGLTSVNYNAENCTSMGSLSYRVFNGCSNIKTVNIGSSVKTIPNEAFSGCSSLISITIPNSVTSIGNFAFYGCSGLTSVNYNAENCTSMGSLSCPVFRGCSNIKMVNIGSSVKTIPAYSFDECTGLTDVNITDLSAWCKIDFENSTASPLYYAKKLKLNGVEIKDLVIPNDITEIRNYAFYNCTGLTSVTIPNSVTSIGDEAFSYCWDLETIVSLNPTPPVCSRSESFYWSNATLYVPKDSYAKYFIDEVWGKFINIKKIEILASSILLNNTSIELDKGNTATLTALISPSNATIKNIVWTSSNPLIATVDQSGKVTALSAGTATIIAQTIDGSNISVSCKVVVKDEGTKITLSQTEANLPVNGIMTLSYVVTPPTTPVEWSTSNANVAYIKRNSDNSVTVVGVADGEAIITATATDGSGASASCKVIVGVGGVEGVETDNNSIEVSRYDIHGRRLNEPTRGVNIVIYSDGSTRKEIIKE